MDNTLEPENIAWDYEILPSTWGLIYLSLSLSKVSGVMASIHACWLVHQKQWKEMVSCLLLSKMQFIILNSKILLLLEALQTLKLPKYLHSQ